MGTRAKKEGPGRGYITLRLRGGRALGSQEDLKDAPCSWARLLCNFKLSLREGDLGGRPRAGTDTHCLQPTPSLSVSREPHAHPLLPSAGCLCASHLSSLCFLRSCPTF